MIEFFGVNETHGAQKRSKKMYKKLSLVPYFY